MEIDMQVISQAVVALVGMGLLLYIMATVGERGTEVLKALLQLIAKLPVMEWIKPGGYVSWIAALFVAAAGVFGFKVDFFAPFFSQFEIFDDLSPELLTVASWLILWVMENVIHNKKVLPPAPSSG